MKGWRSFEQRVKVFTALADPTRLQIVELLAQGEELTGKDMASRLGISLALFCHHGKILISAGVIKKRRNGQTTYSGLNRALVEKVMKSLLATRPSKARPRTPQQ